MVEYYIKGQAYSPGTILKWKNGTKIQIQQNGGHKIVATKKISFQNNFEMKVWAEKNTKFFYICGPFLVVFGILKVFGIV